MKILKTLLCSTILALCSCTSDMERKYSVNITDESGKTISKLNPVDSTVLLYTNDGLSFMTGNVRNGKMEGVWDEYNLKGVKTFRWTYENDKKNGLYICYSSKGKIDAIGSYKDNKLDGVLVSFDQNGKATNAEVWEGKKNSSNSSTMVYEKRLD